MPNNSFIADIRCPFFQQLQKGMLICEAPDDGECMLTRFADPARRRAHLRRYCNHADGGGCFLAATLFRKYDEEERARADAGRRRLAVLAGREPG